MDWHDILAILSPIITLFILVIGGLVSYFTIIGDIKTRLIRLETQISPFWGIVEKELIKLVHSPHTPEIDKLLDNMMDNTLTKEEAEELKCKLRDELNVPDYGKKLAIILLIARLDQFIKGVE
jgi:hypothetical protein